MLIQSISYLFLTAYCYSTAYPIGGINGLSEFQLESQHYSEEEDCISDSDLTKADLTVYNNQMKALEELGVYIPEISSTKTGQKDRNEKDVPERVTFDLENVNAIEGLQKELFNITLDLNTTTYLSLNQNKTSKFNKVDVYSSIKLSLISRNDQTNYEEEYRAAVDAIKNEDFLLNVQ